MAAEQKSEESDRRAAAHARDVAILIGERGVELKTLADWTRFHDMLRGVSSLFVAIPTEAFLGHTITGVDGGVKGSPKITFDVAEHGKFEMYHMEDCCESVELEDVCGDWSDIIGRPLSVASLVSNSSEHPSDKPPTEYQPESFTYSYYTFGTDRGTVTLRWFGESNGYYSETADIYPVRA